MTTITGRQIRDDTITGDHVQDGSLEWRDFSEAAKATMIATVLEQLARVALSGDHADLVGQPRLGRDPGN